ncbi:unnamed protein product [Fraxinus pennsylvanica]|uniref:Uncharacterized protein n=1 Tax=Fraxinus pennsylvanica TaxID=56036 RepID=A0AAD2EBU3_9LAMI|nr:unnamed protein product [Fraxinus pennsylvanica]
MKRGFESDPVSNLVVGLTFCHLWYSGLPKELRWTELDSFGLPSWLLPLHLPTSRETYEGLMNKHRKFHNDYYKSALKHLLVSLQSTVPIIEAFHPLIQMLLLGDQLNEALDELEKSFKISDTVLQLRMKAALLEHFSGINNVKLYTCFEDILKKDPTCSNSLARLVVMHQRALIVIRV